MFSDKLTCPILKFTYHSKKSGGPKGSRNCSYKKERKENIKNVFREAYLPNPKVYLLFQKIQESGGFKETVSTKKKEKRTLVTFSEKPIHPKPNFTYPFSFYFQFPEIRSPKSCSYKKERKRMLETFSKKFPTKFHLPVSNSKRSESQEGLKKPFLQKKRKKIVRNVLKEISHQIPLTSFQFQEIQKSGGSKEAIPTKRKKKER